MFKTLADPVFNSIINKGELTMNDIICDTTEEHNHAPQPSTYTPTASTTLINPSLCESTQTQPVQGVSGATYAPMDTSPKTPEQDQNARVKMLMEMLTTTLNQLVKELQTPSQPQTDLEEAVNTTLENAEWFDGRVSNYLDEKIENTDFDYEIGQNIERYFRNQFDPSDHFDIEEAVKDRVVDEVESIIDGLVEEAVEARLADLLEEKLANANITINF
jgi:DNA primase